MDEQPVVDDNDSYKKQLMDQLEKKVEEKCKYRPFLSLILRNFFHPI